MTKYLVSNHEGIKEFDTLQEAMESAKTNDFAIVVRQIEITFKVIGIWKNGNWIA